MNPGTLVRGASRDWDEGPMPDFPYFLYDAVQYGHPVRSKKQLEMAVGEKCIVLQSWDVLQPEGKTEYVQLLTARGVIGWARTSWCEVINEHEEEVDAEASKI